jgi:hypothetical protein
MPATFNRELRRILTPAGCHFVRPGKGSHEIWHSPIANRHFVLLVQLSADIPRTVSQRRGLAKVF